MVGNGFSSSVVVYAVDQSDNKYTLQLLWQVAAASSSATEDETQTADGMSCPQQDPLNKRSGPVSQRSDPLSHMPPSSQRSGRDYHYCNAFTMAEVNPNGRIFVVEEKEDGAGFIHLFSESGELLKCVNVSHKSIVLLSPHNAGLHCYGLVVQGGKVLIMCDESLEIRSVFKVVRKGTAGGIDK